jgi:hypothetical protein
MLVLIAAAWVAVWVAGYFIISVCEWAKYLEEDQEKHPAKYIDNTKIKAGAFDYQVPGSFRYRENFDRPRRR